MARNKPRKGLPEGDDGRTIVSMNVEGMPWYAPESAEASLRREAEKAGVIQLVKHPENGETWVKLLSNQLPI